MHEKPCEEHTYDVIVVGAGIAGIYCAYQLKKMGVSFAVLEAGSGIGGTWFWNRYPGARCDIESTEYSYQFSEELQQQWEWPERYASQKDVLKYLQHVTKTFSLSPFIRLSTTVISQHYKKKLWRTTTKNGDTFISKFCIMATGAVSSPRTPHIDGMKDFLGDIYHTSEWPEKKVDFSNKRVAVIGTGTSGIQCIPIIAKSAKALHVYQRTANYYVPIQNAPSHPAIIRQIKKNYPAFRHRNAQLPAGYSAGDLSNTCSALSPTLTDSERALIFESAWQRGGFYFQSAFNDLLKNPDSNRLAADFIRKKIRALVNDPETAEKLCPKITFGCKRLSMGKGYYETFNQKNVFLHDISKNGIKAITSTEIELSDNKRQAVDIIVFATGFNDMVGALRKIHITGDHGLSLNHQWNNKNPTMHLGMMTANFPNMFFVTGPGSPSITTNMFATIEQNIDWICRCINHVNNNQLSSIEVSQQVQEQWADQVNQRANETQ